MDRRELELARDGAQYAPGEASDDIDFLRRIACAQGGANVAGLRITGCAELARLFDSGTHLGALAQRHLGAQARPVRAILFDKSATTNWVLGWHQDRTIAVQKRVEVAGYGPWSTKQGILHVAPPISLIERMITLRVHLDDVPEQNAPLLIAIGSHRMGWIAQEKITRVVESSEIFTCTASAGDVWIYRTSILHASTRTEVPNHRRVLQVDFAAEELPGGLEWLGI